MDRILLVGALLSFSIAQIIEGHPAELSPEVLGMVKVIYAPTETTRETRLSQERSQSSPADFQLPRHQPCFLTLETKSNLGGRLNLYLEPESLPGDLSNQMTEQRRSDAPAAFQAVIDTRPGQWKRHTLDISRDFFETIRAETYPYDPRGLKISRLHDVYVGQHIGVTGAA